MEKINIIQSAGGIIYYRDGDTPRFLLIKRLARSHKIERVAPKGKIQKGEKIEDAVQREVSEEAGIPINQMKLRQKIGTTQLRNNENIKGYINKDVTRFLIQYTGDPDGVYVEEVEGYLGVYKRANIQEILNLIYYPNIREIFRSAYKTLHEKNKKDAIRDDFMKKFIE